MIVDIKSFNARSMDVNRDSIPKYISNPTEFYPPLRISLMAILVVLAEGDLIFDYILENASLDLRVQVTRQFALHSVVTSRQCEAGVNLLSAHRKFNTS
jgi:hypothetical protein